MDAKSRLCDKGSADDSIPTYEESERIQSRTFASRLAQVQRNRIQNLVTNHIEPLLNKHAESGLFKAALAFILSDVSLLRHGSNGDAVGDTLLKFPEDEFTCVDRLEGEENGSRFWKQPAVIKDLERALQAKLGVSVYNTPSPPPKAQDKSTPTDSTQTNSRKWSFFGKRTMPQAPMPAVIPKFTQAGAGWRAPDPFPSNPAQTTVSVSYEDVYVRVQTDMGLYQTRNCPALVVRYHLGH